MALTVEDGTGLVDADSYVSVVDADTYFALYPNAAWTGDGATKEVGLRRATRFLDIAYRYIGVRKTTTQSLEWPRSIPDPDRVEAAVPLPIVEACCELAVRALGAELVSDTDGISLKSFRVGPVREEYFTPPGRVGYTEVRMILRRLLEGSVGGYSIPIHRR